jgi:hypothetical protein
VAAAAAAATNRAERISTKSRKHGTIDPGRPAALAGNALAGGREPKLDPRCEAIR